MSSKMLLTIAGLIALVFAFGFLVVPETAMGIYGIAANPSSILEMRFFGSAFVGLGLVSLAVRNVADRLLLRNILTGFAVSHVVGGGVSAWANLTGLMNPVGWSATAIYALLFIGCLIATPENGLAKLSEQS